MVEFITKYYIGETVTLSIKGLPLTITGKVVKSSGDDVVTLRLADGNKVVVAGKTIVSIVQVYE